MDKQNLNENLTTNLRVVPKWTYHPLDSNEILLTKYNCAVNSATLFRS